MEERKATVQRETRETKVSVELSLDGTGQYSVNTGNGFFDHLLSQLARHSLMDLTVEAEGDAEKTGWHHTVEDVSIAVGRALNQALGDGRGIMRMGHSMVPFDETLVQVAVDLSGRAYAIVDTTIDAEMVESLPAGPRPPLPGIHRDGRPLQPPRDCARGPKQPPQGRSPLQSPSPSPPRRHHPGPPPRGAGAKHQGDHQRVGMRVCGAPVCPQPVTVLLEGNRRANGLSAPSCLDTPALAHVASAR